MFLDAQVFDCTAVGSHGIVATTCPPAILDPLNDAAPYIWVEAIPGKIINIY